uniref:Ketoreductase (KR) domain-containing protein n=1 Tax=Chromera velia CCMP2878 TaxID=1169474 RepID=A0A0G4FE41_9ALVE|eukprot:Cvel_3225.t1-p1 / transcript=Cvel_3225.t1 / gene=Cvel_3225 / organism=Chromera_velia_CCMP2878 / gene_product=3-keto-steroid reductase, putative / transcript_product=3-keto-steroid reductase, putative / location=Cvel_scaffold126:57675-59849(-) / protein_length=508 / sequence_SO=supercontig / SO=protein_coding / is_pseudo=false
MFGGDGKNSVYSGVFLFLIVFRVLFGLFRAWHRISKQQAERRLKVFNADHFSCCVDPSQEGKKTPTALITGANSGIGLALAARLADAGVHTFLACRSVERGQKALENITATMPETQRHLVELIQVDVSAPSSVKKAVEVLKNRQIRIDMLFFNAGQMAHQGENWEVLLGLFSPSRIGHFFETSRATPMGESILCQRTSKDLTSPPTLDFLGTPLAPEFAVHVAGHFLFLSELHEQGCLHPRTRCIWTGSRAASRAALLRDLETAGGKEKGVIEESRVPFDCVNVKDPYGASKYLTDLLSGALTSSWAHANGFLSPSESDRLDPSIKNLPPVLSLSACPGVVATSVAPPMLLMTSPLHHIIASVCPGFRVTTPAGAEVLLRLAAMTLPVGEEGRGEGEKEKEQEEKNEAEGEGVRQRKKGKEGGEEQETAAPSQAEQQKGTKKEKEREKEKDSKKLMVWALRSKFVMRWGSLRCAERGDPASLLPLRQRNSEAEGLVRFLQKLVGGASG